MRSILNGKAMVGGILTCEKFESLGKDEIYKSPEPKPDDPPGTAEKHLVLFLGFGIKDGKRYLVFQNSQGVLFGEDGIGRVWFDCVRDLCTITVTGPQPPPPLSLVTSYEDPRPALKLACGFPILVSGLQGIGAEIAKNLAFSGLNSITLHDDSEVQLWDLSSSFLLTEKDLGKNRAEASAQKLQELNKAVTFSCLPGPLTTEHLSQFRAVVFTDISLEKAVEYDQYCHNHEPPIAFIKSEVRGLFGSVFCDFGPSFTVLDDGEEPLAGIVSSISNEKSARVSCVNGDRLEFQDGDLVLFSNVHGMNELDDGHMREVRNARRGSFMIDEDTSSFGQYTGGATVTQVKPPKVIEFRPLKEAMKEPSRYIMSHFSRLGRPTFLHIAFQALDKFRNEFKRFPVAGSTDDVQRLLDFAFSINESLGHMKLKEIDNKLLQQFANGSMAILNPMAAMFGGIVGQEVVKACSGRFHPLSQFLYFDSIESLPVESLEPEDVKPQNSRYDAQISIFGSKFQKKLEQAKICMIVSRKFGSEFLKNLTLMGVSCCKDGKLTLADDDSLDNSNHNTLILFPGVNIGTPKSTADLAATALAINHNLHVDLSSLKTESVLNGLFWENFDAVVNALDDVTAKMYIDSRCVYFLKPLLETSIVGAKCGTQTIVPDVTNNYEPSRDPLEKLAPACSVHLFPQSYDHCLTWARSEFEALFEKTPCEVNEFLGKPDSYVTAKRADGDSHPRDQFERILECLHDKCVTFQDCIKWARLKFEEYFSNRMKQLMVDFPEDLVTSSGALFWAAPKRLPRPLNFSSAERSHRHFILVASLLKAEMCRIAIPNWAKGQNRSRLVADEAIKLTVPDFKPKQSAAAVEKLIAKLEEVHKTLPSGFHMNRIQFEKDNGTDMHMTMITGFANLRAQNFNISQVDALKARYIAGKAIGALPTSLSVAAGLVCLELYKVIAGGHMFEDYRNTGVNLAKSLLFIAEPVPPWTIKDKNMSWTVWTRWSIPGNFTVRQVTEWLKAKGLNAYSITCGAFLLYNSMLLEHKERFAKKVVDVAREAANTKVALYGDHIDLVVACKDDDGNDVNIPTLSVYFSEGA